MLVAILNLIYQSFWYVVCVHHKKHQLHTMRTFQVEYSIIGSVLAVQRADNGDM